MTKPFVGIIVIAAVLGGIFLLTQPKSPKGNAGNAVTIDAKSPVVVLSLTPDYTYTPQVIQVKAGTKVRIEGDPNKLTGSMDTIIVDGYDVKKKISGNDNVLEFVADKTGEFRIHCANNMGNGKLIVN